MGKSTRRPTTWRTDPAIFFLRPGKPFEHLALDFIGPLEKTSRGHSSILTIVNLFTKFPILIPTRDQCASTVVKALLESVITIFGVPKTILLDRGSAFISCIFKGICKAMGVSAVNTTAWRPQSNGAVERLNRTVIESLRRCEASSNWDDILPMVALAIRTTEHSSTGFTPAKLVFGHELRLPQPFQEAGQSPVSEDLIAQTAAFYERELTEEVEKIREVVRQTYLNEQEEARIKFENKRLRTFNNGDLVLVERMHETKGRHKFEPSCRMVETRSGKMQDPAQERIKAEESAKPQLGATIGGDASSDPVVLNPNIDIPKYHGTEDPRPWIESLEEIGFLYHWADYIIARYAAMNMTGSAKTWLNLHKASFTSWENIKIRLIQDFSLDANKEELRMKLNRMQHWNEPAIRFAEDILVLCNKVDPAMEEETKIDHVIGGL
ncbi:hypothetical protein LAZ67_15003129 [Cordylochernes scorpioides]|uniref:Integrase catalytic domain-containing protein n=1 Tax=Cordylochernes scorpioides TaxID=51811 RepID=A0ABY6LB92_9ARAC|nr:hypothetical protein LAZ67_15003129 [Cordylochernes scorpioides]